MESEPDEALVSAMSHDPDLDSLLEYPFGAGDIDSLYNVAMDHRMASLTLIRTNYQANRWSHKQSQRQDAFGTPSGLVLWRLSVSNHGFPLLTANNYAWNYGPTAVLTVIMSIWNQTTYCCKLLGLWKELKTGPLGPEKTVLLDYISPILPVNLWKATRFRHAPVLVAIYAGIILRIVTVASTGLLSPVKMPMPSQIITLEALTTFNTDNYDLGLGYSNSLRESAINYEAYALIADNLPFPDDFCQCVLDVMLVVTHPNEIDIAFITYLPVTRQLYGGIPSRDYTCHDATKSFWSFVALFDVRYNQTAIPSAILRAGQSNSSDTWGIQIVEATSVACSINYSMIPAQVTYDLSRNPLTPTVDLPDGSGTYLPGPFIEGFPARDFAYRLHEDVDNADFMVGSFITNSMDEFAPSTFVQMILPGGGGVFEVILQG
ncbi:hypothetical protein LA080_008336 [Diaporthe eres]|nr:hypothetical protein LA080_008336 [Diaporthe eres]